jgi:hypothetical protein
MLTFNAFLKEVVQPQTLLWEELLIEAKNARENDDMGKFNELRLAYHLSHEDSSQKRMPEHHRSKNKEDPLHNGDPQTVHDNILGRLDPKKANMIDVGADDSANAWRKQTLKPGEKVGKVYWTSNRDTVKKNGDLTPGDHFKTTGVHDPNSNADLMAQIVHHKTGDHIRWEPISAKIGKNDPNLSNPGISSLEKMSNHEAGHFSNMETPHTDHVVSLGYHPDSRDDRHAQWKIDALATNQKEGGIDAVRKEVADLKSRHERGEKLESNHKKYIAHGETWLNTYDSLKPEQQQEMMAKAKHRAQSAVDSSLHIRKAITQKISDGLNARVKKNEDGTFDDSDLRATLYKSYAPETRFKHKIVHSRISSDGNTITPEVHDADGYAKDHFNRFANLRVVAGDGITSYVKGHLKDEKGDIVKDKNGNPKEMSVAQIAIKGTSGPMMGNAGSMSLINRKDE